MKILRHAIRHDARLFKTECFMRRGYTMLDAVKNYSTFIDRTNPLTKILLAAILFVTVIFIHNPNVLFHLTIIMLIMLLLLSGVKIKYLTILLIFILISGFISSLYMIFYGEGTQTL